MDDVGMAADAIERGELIVYPTETVYGLGGDATDEAAIDRIFDLKGRARSNPLSVAIPDLDGIEDVASPTPATRAFMEHFLPGPVTVICRRSPDLPDLLTAGKPRVGVRIPDHPLAAAVLERTPPLTATSANRTGGDDASTAAAVDEHIRDGVAVVLDGGQTAGRASTVVDVDRGEILRHGTQAEAIAAWLSDS